MIHVLTSPSCASCRKVHSGLTHYQIPFVEKDISKVALEIEELKFILSLTENVVDDILSKRSKIYQTLNIDFEQLSLKQTLDLIIEHPYLLRRPISYNQNKLIVGFNEDDIRIFLPNEVRVVQRRELLKNNVIFLNRDFFSEKYLKKIE